MPALEIIAIGRLKDQAEKNLENRYLERIRKAGPMVGIRQIAIQQLNESARGTCNERKAEEGTSLLKKASEGAYLIAMDEHGKQLASKTFAARLKTLLEAGHPSITFLLGGPDGHDPDLLKKVSETHALSKLTFPHGLARILLLEQIYRSLTIWSGHPYHRQ